LVYGSKICCVQVPEKLLQSLEGIKGFDKNAFEAVHASGEQVTSIRYNPAKRVADMEPLMNIEQPDHSPARDPHRSPFRFPVPWSSCGYYLATRPSFTFDPLFHAGTYYVQEASSMFLEQALKQTVDVSGPLRVLDLCAAPGGKSTLLQSLINKESLLVSNEVIKSRAAVLEENLTKWGGANTVVTNNEPAHFARLENYFDVVVVDAPCSGSGLFRRDPEAVNEWSENSVSLCSQRQQRIIADVWPALKQDGVLIYSTCSYSKEENEAVLDGIFDRMKVKGIRLKAEKEWNIIETLSDKNGMYGYRFYPDKIKGEGFFIAVLQKQDGNAFAGKPGKNKMDKLSKAEETVIQPWLKEDADLVLFKQKEDIIALPVSLQNDIAVLQSALYIKKAGVTAGKLAGSHLIPDHALAVSSLINKNIPRIELNRQQAIQYLRREAMQLPTEQKGWVLAGYLGYNLGWIKILPNRFNNYYPKEWRIIKQPV
jgi:16S rRNA C967 or C1407 C5-methylase (RsmB/RsmF family)/NOL1/NOP2/fmu family ribosome biogenesis protein